MIASMQVMLVRHARAVSKREWAGPDLLRPLDDVGERQAMGLVDTLAETPIRRLGSSPALRCVQTLEPLASHHGIVHRDERLCWLPTVTPARCSTVSETD